MEELDFSDVFGDLGLEDLESQSVREEGSGFDFSESEKNKSQTTKNKPTTLKTEQEVPSNTEDFSVNPLIEDLFSNFGIAYEEEKFANKDMTDMNTLYEAVNEIISTKSKPKYSSAVAEQFDKYISRGGNPEEFFANNMQSIRYAELDLSDPDVQLDVAYNYFLEMGHDEDEAREMTQDLSTSKLLAKQVGTFAKKLDKIDDDRVALAKRQEQEVAERERRNFEEWLDDRKTTILNSDGFSGLKFKDVKDKENFFKFAHSRDKAGKTEFDKLREADKNFDLKMLMLAYRKVHENKVEAFANDVVAKKVKDAVKAFSHSGTRNNVSMQRNDNGETNLDNFVIS